MIQACQTQSMTQLVNPGFVQLHGGHIGSGSRQGQGDGPFPRAQIDDQFTERDLDVLDQPINNTSDSGDALEDSADGRYPAGPG